MYRPIVIAGSRSQFADWCRAYQTNPIAAIYVETPAQLRAALFQSGDVRLWGDYRRNPAYRAWALNRAA
jgi:hypothetical protein